MGALQGKSHVGILFCKSQHFVGGASLQAVATFYQRHAAAKGFELVSVSFDSDEASFASAVSSAPWFALPFARRDL